MTTNDLPPKWDGRAVNWYEWQPIPRTSLDYHLPPDPCDNCRQVHPEITARGHIQLPLNVAHKVSAHRKRLDVVRCTGCGHDTVTDGRGQTWDLDPLDYGPDGSHDYS